jgi:hypothetical protein
MQPEHDKASDHTYDRLMAGANAYINVTIDTKNPIELGDFVSEFTSVSAQCDKFMRENHPDLAPGAQMFVKQVRRGSIIFELLPYAPNLLFGPDIVSTLDSVKRRYRVCTRIQNEDRRLFGPRSHSRERNSIGFERFHGSGRRDRKRPQWQIEN